MLSISPSLQDRYAIVCLYTKKVEERHLSSTIRLLKSIGIGCYKTTYEYQVNTPLTHKPETCGEMRMEHHHV